MSVSAISNPATGTGQSAASSTQLAKDYESFLTLLVAQIQNQDPLAPMESTEFVSQLAQLTQVEQSVQVNSHMESLRQQLALNAALSETSLIGLTVTTPSDGFELGADGGRFWYRLEEDAARVQAQIHDETGTLVRTINGLSGKSGGMIEVTWDGLGDTGLPQAPGRYKLSIAAADAEGASGSYDSYAAAEVVAVDYSDGLTYLQLKDGSRVASGEIIRAE